MTIYTAHHRKKNNASTALDAPSTIQKEMSSVYHENVWLTQIVLNQDFHVIGPATAKMRQPYV